MLGRNFSDTTPIISETNKNMAVVRSDKITIPSKEISLEAHQQCNMGSELVGQQSYFKILSTTQGHLR